MPDLPIDPQHDPDVSGSIDRWCSALDELEASIDRYSQLALAAYGPSATTPEVPALYVLPPDLGPVPSVLRDRADELVGRAESVQTELFRVRDLVASQLAGLSKAPHANAYHDSREPSYLDAHG